MRTAFEEMASWLPVAAEDLESDSGGCGRKRLRLEVEGSRKNHEIRVKVTSRGYVPFDL